MYTKIAIFAIISAVIATSISGSSVAYAVETSCFTVKTNTKLCTSSDVETWQECTKQKDGTWKCKQMEAVIDNIVPPELQDAIDIASEDIQNNDTKVPKTGVLDGPGALSDDESTENGDDTEIPKDPGGLNNDNGPTINPGGE